MNKPVHIYDLAGTLNRNYYKMHLENVHSIQANKELLLNWILNTQKLSGQWLNLV